MASLIPSAWRKIHPSTISAALVGAVIALVAIGPIVVAPVIFRWRDDETASAREDWIRLVLILGVAVVSAALIAGGISSKLRKRRRRR
jgi:hypothetical protein